jgi:hypothetical protein
MFGHCKLALQDKFYFMHHYITTVYIPISQLATEVGINKDAGVEWAKEIRTLLKEFWIEHVSTCVFSGEVCNI